MFFWSIISFKTSFFKKYIIIILHAKLMVIRSF